eukprot:112131-Alexandrium_andersonii.AAC.1
MIHPPAADGHLANALLALRNGLAPQTCQNSSNRSPSAQAASTNSRDVIAALSQPPGGPAPVTEHAPRGARLSGVAAPDRRIPQSRGRPAALRSPGNCHSQHFAL